MTLILEMGSRLEKNFIAGLRKLKLTKALLIKSETVPPRINKLPLKKVVRGILDGFFFTGG
ncbi:hypothetical protein [Cyclobacterium sediminis]